MADLLAGDSFDCSCLGADGSTKHLADGYFRLDELK